jgi:hypothetical protein
MKTSLVAMVGAALFLLATLVGIGGQGSPPSAPGTITLQTLAGANQPIASSVGGLVTTSATPTATGEAGPPSVVTVNRNVQSTNLPAVLAGGPAKSAAPAGSSPLAAGEPATPPDSLSFRVPVDVTPNLPPPPPSPTGSAAQPGPVLVSPSPLPSIPLLGSVLPSLRPEPKRTPSPTPTPTPPVTATATAPVTATAWPR